MIKPQYDEYYKSLESEKYRKIICLIDSDEFHSKAEKLTKRELISMLYYLVSSTQSTAKFICATRQNFYENNAQACASMTTTADLAAEMVNSIIAEDSKYKYM